jgi:hypothetical protein
MIRLSVNDLGVTQVSSCLDRLILFMKTAHRTSTLLSSISVSPSSEYVMVFRYTFKLSDANYSVHIYADLQEIAWNFKGTVKKCDHREYGSAKVQIVRTAAEDGTVSKADTLFEGLGDDLDVSKPHYYCCCYDIYTKRPNIGLDVSW